MSVKITAVDKIRVFFGLGYSRKTQEAISIETERAYAEFQLKLKKTAAKVKAEAKPVSKSAAKRVAVEKKAPAKSAKPATKAPAKKAPAAKKPAPKKSGK